MHNEKKRRPGIIRLTTFMLDAYIRFSVEYKIVHNQFYPFHTIN